MKISSVRIIFFLIVLGCTFPGAAQINFCGEPLPIGKADVQRNFIAVLQKVRKKCSPETLYNRAKKYFPYVESRLAAYGIPNDFKYLPLIESGFVNYGPNEVGAAGVWAIMPETAKMFEGLRIGPGIDERMDFVKATEFSMKLIRWLYDRLGSWTLTAAAYNGGIGRIEGKIKKEGHRDFYRMRLVPETAEYVLKMVTFKELFSAGMDISAVLDRIDNKRVGVNTDTIENWLTAKITDEMSFTVSKEKADALFNTLYFPGEKQVIQKNEKLKAVVVGWLGSKVTIKLGESYFTIEYEVKGKEIVGVGMVNGKKQTFRTKELKEGAEIVLQEREIKE